MTEYEQTLGHPYLLDNIKRRCYEKGLSISALERAAGLGNGVIRKWNSASPTLRTVIAVADYLGVTVNDLLKNA